MQETSKKSGHDLQIRKVVHKVAVLHEVVEVAGGFDDAEVVVELSSFVTLALDGQQKVFVVVVGYGELVQQTVLLEYSEAEMEKRGVPECFVVFEHVEVPDALVEVLHHFDGVVPDPGVDVDDLSKLFIVFLVFFVLFGFSVDLFQKVVEITFEPFGGIICSIRGDVQPSFCVNVHVFLLVGHVEVELVKFVRLYEIDCPESLLLHVLGNFSLFHNRLENFDDSLDWIVVFVLMSEFGLVARYLS